MFESLMATMLVYGALIWAPGLLAMNHPRTVSTPNVFLRAWSLAAVAMWAPFGLLWSVLGWETAALFWACGSVVVTALLVASALLARTHMSEMRAREARISARF